MPLKPHPTDPDKMVYVSHKFEPIFKEIQVGNYVLRFYPSDTGWMCGITTEMMNALQNQTKEKSND